MSRRKIGTARAHVRGILTTSKRKGWLKTRIKMQKGRCALCGEVMHDDATIDHHVPLSRGGEDCFDNTQATHRRCNQIKGDRLPDEIASLCFLKNRS